MLTLAIAANAVAFAPMFRSEGATNQYFGESAFGKMLDRDEHALWLAELHRSNVGAFDHSASETSSGLGAFEQASRLSMASNAIAPIEFDESGAGLEDDPKYISLKTFEETISSLNWKPNLWIDDEEIVFEWIDGERHAVVSIEDDGVIAYSYVENDQFVPGADVDASINQLPDDLALYLNK